MVRVLGKKLRMGTEQMMDSKSFKEKLRKSAE
jgi:hypothetical protein